MEIKSKLRQQVVRIKQWFKKHTYKDERFSFWRFLCLIGYVGNIMRSFKILFSASQIAISLLYECIPFLLELFELLETLASTLSYNKKEIFYEFY